MSRKWLSNFALAGTIRLLLMNSEYQKIIGNRVEVSTALNSWKRVTEGVYLYEFGIDPYEGDLFHETPIGLYVFKFIQKYLPQWALFLLFVVTDLTTALCLALTAKRYAIELATKRKEGKEDDRKSTDISGISALYVSAGYLFNPYIILNCVGLTTTVFTNLLYSIALVSMTRRSMFWSCISIALLTLQGLYPMSLMVPATIYVASPARNRRTSIITMLIIFMKMFEHFRWLFIASFQINVSLLYIVPLALRLRRDPMLLAFSYLAIAAIFKSYPCIGDVGFYISLLPLWKHLFQHMQQGFIVGCFLLFCTVFAPTVWHQWIYSRSANANFYFGVTLAFAIAQIFLLTDILFASVKHEFAIQHGINKKVNGNEAKLLLE
ncbi:hypothetical protein ACFW04_000738 [Cataglyphis niger]